ncbi:hypothetical protein [Actinoplanes sp. NPDC049599]|uniref:hypothetical protein n=1 Tax=Actinoplanes sp. NPDC049599 TaxID=3363903 RepID=UPI0037A2ABD7
MSRVLVFLAMVGVLAACTPADSGGGPVEGSAGADRSGVRGIAIVDVGCPVLEGSSPCPQVPLRARIAAGRPGQAGRLVAVETTDDGRFEIVLAPGTYELRGENLAGQPVPSAMPVTVVVHPGQFSDAVVVFDSGIRGAPSDN